MQSIPPQDRPKLAIVVIGIGVALASIARDGLGTPAPAEPQARPAAVTSPALCRLSLPAGVAGAKPLREGEQTDNPVGLTASPGPLLHDPFHPIPAQDPPRECIKRSALAPVSPVRPVTAARPLLPDRIAAPAPPASPRRQEVKAIGAKRSSREPAPPGDRQPVETPPLALIGTAGGEAGAVAAFRVGSETVFAAPQETVAGWRVARIAVGKVWLSRGKVQRLVRAGNSLADEPGYRG